jgi:hypothetical protein
MILPIEEIWSSNKHQRAAMYWKAGKWRLYERSTYPIRNIKSAIDLIRAVMEDKHIALKNVKLVQLKSVVVEVDKTYDGIY